MFGRYVCDGLVQARPHVQCFRPSDIGLCGESDINKFHFVSVPPGSGPLLSRPSIHIRFKHFCLALIRSLQYSISDLYSLTFCVPLGAGSSDVPACSRYCRRASDSFRFFFLSSLLARRFRYAIRVLIHIYGFSIISFSVCRSRGENVKKVLVRV